MSRSVPKLKIDGLSKKYGEHVALEPIQMEVQAGELITILGPSGSGKTTLLHLISGLASPSAGNLLIDGKDETHRPVHQRDIGVVFQNYALFPHLTVYENIAFPLKMRRLSSAEIGQRVSDAIRLVRLDTLEDRFPSELSGGQQQRVALARCFVYRPSIILMDEPLGALDKKLRESMQVEIKRLHRETGATIVYVTHDQDEAMALSDRVCLMNVARIEQFGAPRELYYKPNSVFSAQFIGISNTFTGKIEYDASGSPLIATPDGTFDIMMEDAAKPERGSAATLVLRPEHIDISPAHSNAITGRTIETVYAGSQTLVMLALPSGNIITIRIRGEQNAPALGDLIPFSWRPEAGVLVAR